MNGHYGLGTGIWLGGNDEAVEGHFVWLPSGQPVVFSDWGDDQPDDYDNDADGQDCMVYFYGAKAWHDVRCDRDYIDGLICEGWHSS